MLATRLKIPQFLNLDLVSRSVITARPNAILPRRQNPLGVQRVLNRLIKLHLGVPVKVIRPRDLVHQRQMRSILAPPFRRCVVDQRRDERVRPRPRGRVFAVKDEADDMVHLAHADAERAEEIEAGLLAAGTGEGVLGCGVISRHLRNGREEEVGTVGEPVPVCDTSVLDGDSLGAVRGL